MKYVNAVSKQEQQESIAALTLVLTQTHMIDLTLKI